MLRNGNARAGRGRTQKFLVKNADGFFANGFAAVSAPTDYLIDRLADLQDDIDAAFATIASEEARNK